MLSPQFSVQRPAFFKQFIQWGSFEIGLIRVGASPEFTTVISTMSRLNFRTYLTHCEMATSTSMKKNIFIAVEIF